MFPTCSNRLLAGRNALSATDLTICSSGRRPVPPPSRQQYSMGWRAATHNRHSAATARVRAASGGMFPAPWGRRPPSAPTACQHSEVHMSRAPLAAVARRGRDRRLRVRRRRRAPGRRRARRGVPGRGAVGEVPDRSAARPDARSRARGREHRLGAVPNLAVTISTGDARGGGSFSVRSEQPGLADPNRPVWILENGFPKVAEPGESRPSSTSAPPPARTPRRPTPSSSGRSRPARPRTSSGG